MIYHQLFSDLQPYSATILRMQQKARDISAGLCDEEAWFLEHESVYTAGTSSRLADELLDKRAKVIDSGRGGRITWHGPGQRVVYLMLNLRSRGLWPRDFVHKIEDWVILALASLGIKGHSDSKNIGVWLSGEDGLPASKVAAIGIRVSRGVTTHGVAINIAPDLSAYGSIIPCGIASADGLVTSVAQHLKDKQALPQELMQSLDKALIDTLQDAFS